MAYRLASAYSVRALRVSQYMPLMRAITFLFVDQSSSRLLEKFGKDIPTSKEVIEAHTLNFKPNFKFSRLNYFFFGGGTPVPVGVCAR